MDAKKEKLELSSKERLKLQSIVAKFVAVRLRAVAEDIGDGKLLAATLDKLAVEMGVSKHVLRDEAFDYVCYGDGMKEFLSDSKDLK